MDLQKNPAILIDKTSIDSSRIFNPNDWENESKAIIQSCATALSLLEYISSNLENICLNSKSICNKHYRTLLQQWNMKKWDVSKCIYYAQIPELHLQISAFFSTAKSLLDVIVKLLSSQNIVNEKINGFHKKNDVIGGYLLNILENNASSSNKQKSKTIHKLIVSQKKLWIDELVNLRDSFIHLDKVAFQVMFLLDIKIKENKLIYLGAKSPNVGEKSIEKYSQETLSLVKEFSELLLQEIKN